MEPEEESEMDDLTRWQHESCVKLKEPLQWWRDNQHRFLYCGTWPSWFAENLI